MHECHRKTHHFVDSRAASGCEKIAEQTTLSMDASSVSIRTKRLVPKSCRGATRPKLSISRAYSLLKATKPPREDAMACCLLSTDCRACARTTIDSDDYEVDNDDGVSTTTTTITTTMTITPFSD